MLEGVSGRQPLLWDQSGHLERNALFTKAGALADLLPEQAFAINLCSRRNAFMVGLLAAMRRNQITLLPPSRASGVIAEFKQRFPDSHVLTDDDSGDVTGPVIRIDVRDLADERPTEAFCFDPEQIAVVAFTSGSTGEASAHEKSWASVKAGALLAAERFEVDQATGVVATVPPQHMYGLETSIFYPLISGCSVHAGRPMFPVEIRDAIEELGTSKTLLVTTPVHLKSLVKSRLDWPRIDKVISATAPLGAELAREVERQLKAPVYEIYGCTEAGSIASRRTVATEIWQLYRGVEFSATDTDGRPVVHGGHVMQPTPLADRLDLIDGTRFRLLGRSVDQVSIAGKRASLGDLNTRLLAIDGVEDGVFVARGADDDGKVRRLGCLYVSSSLNEDAVIDALRGVIDPAFLPRPIRRVSQLPRNDLGKLPYHQLLAMLDPTETASGQVGKASSSAA